MLGRTDSRFRALILLVVFVVAAGSLGVRLAYWQVLRRDELSAMATKQSSMRYTLPSERGSIYDRTGTVTLATSVARDRLAANPALLTPARRAEVAEHLVTLLGLEGDEAEEVTARMPSADERRRLELPDGVPVLVVVRTAYDAAGLPVEVCDTVKAAPAYVLEYDVPAR